MIFKIITSWIGEVVLNGSILSVIYLISYYFTNKDTDPFIVWTVSIYAFFFVDAVYFKFINLYKEAKLKG